MTPVYPTPLLQAHLPARTGAMNRPYRLDAEAIATSTQSRAQDALPQAGGRCRASATTAGTALTWESATTVAATALTSSP